MKKLKRLLVVLLAFITIFTFSACDSGSGSGAELTSEEIYKIAEESVAEIVTMDKNGNSLSLGTAFAISTDGKFITNYHVIEKAYSAKITINKNTYDVQHVMAYDKDIDLAVVKVSAVTTPVKLQENNVSGGMKVYAVGSSEGYTLSFSSGVVASPSRTFDGVEYIQHEAAISHGNSGGPLYNEYGEVIGINTSSDISGQNLNFAISVKEINKLNYTSNLTLAQIYERENDTFTILKDYAISHGDYDSSSGKYDVAFKNRYLGEIDYHLVLYYDLAEKEVSFGLFMTDGDYSCMIFLDVDKVDGSYGWSWVDAGSNYMSGTVNGATWTKYSTLSVSYYNFKYSLLSSAREVASLMMGYLLDSIDKDLSTISITAKDLGFIYY